MPTNVGFILTKWILTVVFMTCTVLVMVTGIINIIYGISFVKEASQYDLTNGSMLIVSGIFASLYGLVMYRIIRKHNPDFWIEGFLLASITVLTLYMIFGSAGITVGARRINQNIVHYLQKLYKADNDYARNTLNNVHQYYQCCGLFGNRTNVKENNKSVSWSCCLGAHKGQSCKLEIAFKLGCEVPISRAHNWSFYSLGSMWISVGTVYLVMVFLAFYFQKVYAHRPD